MVMERVYFNKNWERTIGEAKNKFVPGALTSEKVNLPDDFIIHMERSPETKSGAACGFFPGEKAVYRKVFSVPEEWLGKSVLLDIDGAYMNAEVKVNDEPKGIHPYGYTPWQIPLEDVIIPGEENVIEITTRCIQPNSRWYSGGGLYRQVSLWVGASCHIAPWDAFFTTPSVSEEKSTLRLNVVITNDADEEAVGTLTLSCHIGKSQGTDQISVPVHVAAKQSSGMELELTVHGAKLWSDETPALYEAEITLDTNLGTDTLSKFVGFRCIEIDAKSGMRVNGRKIKLLGGCIHHDNTLLGAAAFPRAEERKLQQLKSAGYNAVRCAHNPPSETFLDACDRLGIYVMNEAFDCFRLGKSDMDYHLYFDGWWKRDLEMMVKRDRSHPCIFCWSVGNEITEMGGTGEGPELTKALADYVRILDTTRPVTAGIHSMIRSKREKGSPSKTPFQRPDNTQSQGKNGSTARQNAAAGNPATNGGQCAEDPRERMKQMMSDPNALEMAMKNIVTNNMGDGYVNGEDVWGELSEASIAALDIVGYNYFYTRYAKDKEKYPDRVIVATETHPLTTYDYYQEMMANENVIGDFIWTAYDNLGEAGAGRVMHMLPDLMSGMLGGWPWLSCYQGDLDLDGNRRPQSFYRKIMWGKDDGVYVFAKHPQYAHNKPLGLGWQWNDVFESWTWPEEYIGQDIYVEAYGDCDEIEFFINGVSCGKETVEKLTASKILSYTPGTLKVVAYKNGKAVAENELVTAGTAAHIELTPDRTEIAADGMDLSFIKVRVTDAEGHTVPTDAIELTAEITMADSGMTDCIVTDKVLAGFGSGNPCTEENYGTGKRRAWNGYALLAVRALNEPGELVVRVTGERLEESCVTVSCKGVSAGQDL